MSDHASFSKMGKIYQEKVVAALLQDKKFAEQMADVLDPDYFDLKYLNEITKFFFLHKNKYKDFPSQDIIEIEMSNNDSIEKNTSVLANDFLKNVAKVPLNGDMRYIQDSSLDFCKRQTLKDAMIKACDKIEDSDYDSVVKIIKDAVTKGSSRDLGHDYIDEFESRSRRSERKPISTGWKPVDAALNGGWERKTLSTFIAPTGAGKSMFLINAGAAAIERGYNVLYITCEMADYKIGLRFDSYFSGVTINDVPKNIKNVEEQTRQLVKGRLFIKEWPTKMASVQMIRSHIQRLKAIKDFYPDFIIVDYADLLRGSRGYGEKRHELEGVYEDLRGLAQEENAVVLTADQTNRSGLDAEMVTLSAIAESYAKATVCDLIMTISRRIEDKLAKTGRLFIAKSRLGDDGKVFPFLLNPATVKVTVIDSREDPLDLLMEDDKLVQSKLQERLKQLTGNKNK